MHGIYCTVLLLVVLAIGFYLYTTKENFYLEPNEIGYSGDPEVYEDSGMDYNQSVDELANLKRIEKRSDPIIYFLRRDLSRTGDDWPELRPKKPKVR